MMRGIISLGIVFLILLIGWGLSSILSKPIEINIPKPLSHGEVGIFAKEVFLKGREEGDTSWEIRADNLEIDLQYKYFKFEGETEGKVYRGKKLSIDIKGNSAELDLEKGILEFPKGVEFSTEDGYRGHAPYAIWDINLKEFVCSKGRIKFEKMGEFKAEADFFRFSTKEGFATFEGNVIIETGI